MKVTANKMIVENEILQSDEMNGSCLVEYYFCIWGILGFIPEAMHRD